MPEDNPRLAFPAATSCDDSPTDFARRPLRDCGERRTLRILTECDPEHQARGSRRRALTGGRQMGKTTAMIQNLAETVQRLERALRQWLCPSCHGTGTSDVPRFVDSVWTEGIFPCRYCQGTGLHPVAAKALGELVDAQPSAEEQP